MTIWLRKIIMTKIRSFVLFLVGTLILTFSSGMVGECHAFSDDAYTQIPGTMLMRGPSVSDATVTNDIEAYQQIPLAIKNMLVGNNIKIYEVNASNGDYSGDAPQTAADKRRFGIICGVTYPISYSWVYANGQLVPTWTDGYVDADSATMGRSAKRWLNPVLHEVCHQMDHMYLGGFLATNAMFNASSQPEWQAIYAAEKGNIASYSATSACNVYTSYEAFAEIAGLTFKDPAWVQAHCPLSYAYVTKVVSWFEESAA